jgi:hypothetical protein
MLTSEIGLWERRTHSGWATVDLAIPSTQILGILVFVTPLTPLTPYAYPPVPVVAEAVGAEEVAAEEVAAEVVPIQSPEANQGAAAAAGQTMRRWDCPQV